MNRKERRAAEKQARGGKGLNIGDLLNRAISAQRQGQWQDAEKIYQALLKAVPDFTDAKHFYGVLLHQTGRSEQGIRFIQRAVQDQPEYLEAWNNLGNVFKEIGDLERAEECYRKILSLNPNQAGALNNLGVVLKDLGNPVGAIQCLQLACEIEPKRADFLQNLGNAYRKQGDVKNAASAFRRSIEVKPYQSDAYRNLWRTLYAAKEYEEALKVVEQWLQYEPDNPVAQHTYAAHKGGEYIPERASDAYVKSLFDGFAASFDNVLKRLDYIAPNLVVESVAQILGEPAKDRRILDAGCGTGLCGPLLRDYASRLVGVDLSPLMLAKASGRQSYDELVETELVKYLDTHPHSFDLIISADTLVYFGELAAFFKAAWQALTVQGLLIFTVEKAEVGDYQLHHHGRYSHSLAYLQTQLALADFTPLSITEVIPRNENNQPVYGWLVTARKPQVHR